MAFAQLTGRESLRDIVTCLRALGSKLYHSGFRGHISRRTLADANETRDFRIYADMAQVLIAEARRLYAGEDFGVELGQTAHALDATTIDLCLSLFLWARYRAQNAAVEMHTLLDLRGSVPAYIDVKPAKIHEIHTLDELGVEPGSIYIMDRGYLDFERLYRLQQALAFFVIRARKDFRFRLLASSPIDKRTGLRCDRIIRLKSFYPAKFYPASLRRIGYRDADTEKSFIFLTNHFLLPTLAVAQLYRCRWHVELLFKWTKQYLHIQGFYGLSPNAVKTQIWIAISIYVLLAIARKHLRLDLSLYTTGHILSLTLFEKRPILQAFSHINDLDESVISCNQLNLFDQ